MRLVSARSPLPNSVIVRQMAYATVTEIGDFRLVVEVWRYGIYPWS